MRRTDMLVLLGAVACAGGDEPTWHADVAPIVDAHCGGCHAPGGVAPFSLRTRDEVAAVAQLVKVAVAERTMPPWSARPADSELLYDPSLSDEQIELITRWIDAGLPEGDPDRPGDPITLDLGGLDGWDLELEMGNAYTPDVDLGRDDYRCHVIDWPVERDTYVTGFEFLPGNLSSVHHVAAYMIPPYAADLADEFDALDEAPGYPCFGSASHDDFVQDIFGGEVFDQRFLAAWAPGISGARYAQGRAGIAIAPGAKIVLQIHYSGNTWDGQPDRSRVRLATSDEVQAEGFYMPWMDLRWPSVPGIMQIPAGVEGVTHDYRAAATTAANATLLGAPESAVRDGMYLHAVFAHMHTLGRSLRYVLHRRDGTQHVILDVEPYDFNWQREYQLAEPVWVAPGDELEVTCTWDNTATWRALRGTYPVEPVDAGWGEGTNDEMCVAHSMITGPEGGPDAR